MSKVDSSGILTRECPLCHNNTDVKMPSEKMISIFSYMVARDDGKRVPPVQVAFPELNADQREHIITGICADCYPSDD